MTPPRTTGVGRIARRLRPVFCVAMTTLGLAPAAWAQTTLRIETGPGGALPLVGAVLAAGDTLRVYAAAYDSSGAYLGPAPVQWRALPDLATLAPAHGTNALVTARTAGSFQIEAKTVSLVTMSGTIVIVPGPTARLAAFASTPGALVPQITTLAVTADSTLVLQAGGFDAFGNFTGTQSVAWSVESPLATLVPTFATLTVVDPKRVGTTRVRLQASGLPLVQIPLTITAGKLASLRLSSSASGPALGDTTLTAGMTLPLFASGFDADANSVPAPPSCTWSVLGTGLVLAAPTGATNSAQATVPGTARVRVASGALQATSGSVYVGAGPLARVRVSRDPNTWVPLGASTFDADATLALHALGQDAAGNWLGTVAATWTTTNAAVATALPNLGPATTVAFARIGSARIVARVTGALPDTSAAIQVVAGRTAGIVIETRANGSGTALAPRTLSCDSTLVVYAVGRDADGNFVGPHAVDWSLTGPIGTLLPARGSSATLAADRPGSAFVTAVDGIWVDLAGPITTVAGAPYQLRLEDSAGAPLAPRVLQPGDMYSAIAIAVDRDGNRIAPSPAAWSWIGDDLAPLPAVPLSRCDWQASRTGSATLRAASSGLPAATSPAIAVVAGAPARLEIHDELGRVVGNRTVAADSLLELHAWAYDGGGNVLGEVGVTWSVIGLGGSADLEPATGSSTILRPRTPGPLRVAAAHQAGATAETGTLTIVPGRIARVHIESAAAGAGTPIGDRALVAGNRVSLFAVGRDAFGNYVAPVTVTWFADGGIGRVETASGNATVFVAEHTGAGRVRAVAALLDGDETGVLTVAPGPVAALGIERGAGDPFDPQLPMALAADDSLVAFAVARDAFGNLAAALATPVWSVVGGAGLATLSTTAPAPSVALRPHRPGSVALRATWNGFTATGGTITIGPGAAAQVRIESAPNGSGVAIGARTLAAGSALALHAVARDAQANFVTAVASLWGVAGTGGTLDVEWGAQSTFRALAPGTCQVTAYAPGLGTATTGTLTITSGAPALLVVERTPGDPADPLTGGTLAAGDSIAAVAVVRDALGNRIGEVVADWSRVGDGGAAVLVGKTGTQTWLHGRHPGQVRVRARWDGREALSGPFDVVPGAPSGPITVALDPLVLRADATSRTQLTAGPIRDAWSNRVADGTRVDVVPARGTILEDDDPARAGAQRATQAGVASATVVAPATAGPLVLDAASGAATGRVTISVLPRAALSPAGFTPAVLLRGAPLDARVAVASSDPQRLDIASGALRFDDGNGDTLLVPLAAPQSVAPGTTVELRFGPAPVALEAGRYAPRLLLAGNDAVGHAFDLDLAFAASTLELLAGGSVHATARTPAFVTRGTSVRFEVEVVNLGDADVVLDAARTVLRAPGFTAAFDPSGGTTLGRGTPVRLAFLPAVWPAEAPAAPAALELDLQGSQPGGAFATLLALDPVQVQFAADLQAGALTPTLTPVGSTPILRLAVTNRGGSAVVLDAATLLQVADRSVALASPERIGPDSSATLEFSPLSTAGWPPQLAALVLHAHGTQNQAAFAQVVAVPDSLTLFAPSALTILGVLASQPSVTRGQTEPWTLGIVLQNAGMSSCRIDAADVRVVLGGVDRTASYLLQRRTALGSTLAAAIVDTLEFLVLRTGDDTGLATLEAAVHGIDLSSGEPVDADTFASGKGSLRVQQPAVPRVTLGAPIPTAAVAGQTGTVAVPITITNDGEAALDVEATGITATPSVPLEVVIVAGSPHLGAGATWTLRAVLGPFTAVPPGALGLDVAPRCVEANRALVLPVAAALSVPVQAAAVVAVTSVEAPAAVLRAGTVDWTVRVGLENRGGSVVRIAAPRLVWTATGPAPQFGVVAPTAFEGRTDLVLAPQSAATLVFAVTPTDGVARSVQVEFAADAEEQPSLRVFAVGGGAQATIQVESEPAVALLDSTLTPVSASRDQQIAPQIVAHQSGEARLVLDGTRSWARVRGGVTQHALAAPLVLDGGSLSTLMFAAGELDAPVGAAPLDVHLEGTAHGEPWSTDLATATHIDIETASSLVITSVRASAARVTRAQTRPWSVRVALRNLGADAVLDGATLGLALGAEDVGSEFTVLTPTTFESGATMLVAGAIDTLRFDVQTTADRSGIVTLDASVSAHDRNSNAPLAVASGLPARGSIWLAEAARPVLVEVTPSQPRVSAGQQAPWRLQIVARNDGESPWRPDWANAAASIGPTADDAIMLQAPSPAPVLEAGAVSTAFFVVQQTGTELGRLDLGVTLDGVQETDGRRLVAAAPAATSVIAERPGEAILDSLVVQTVRAGRANAGQTIVLDVAVANTGESRLEPVTVRLRAAGATPADTVLALAVAGGARTVLHPRLQLRSDPGLVEIELEAQTAADANDSSRTQVWGGSGRRSALLVAEQPGSPQLEVRPSQAHVSAGQTQEWTLEVRVANRGEEALVMRPPQPGDLEFHRHGAVQLDYVVAAPAAFDEGGLELAGGAVGTLLYSVLRTGVAGGSVAITARVAAVHSNDPTAALATASGDAAIDVDAEPGLRIVSTESLTWRRERGHDDYRVDVGQAFQVRVVVENTGGTVIDGIGVDLESQRGNSEIDGPGWLASLAPGESGEVDLACTAGTWLSQAGVPETFTARIVAAVDRNTGLSVLQLPPLDNSTFAWVERAAELYLDAWIDEPVGARDGGLSVGQTCVLAARVDNRGDADLLDTGRLAITLPSNVELLDGPTETFFTPGAVLRWTLRATFTAPPDSMQARIVFVPGDANDGGAARISRDLVTLPITVRSTGGIEARLAAQPAPGARISARQTLVVDAIVVGDADLGTRRGRLEIPADWTFAAGSQPEIPIPDGVQTLARWTLVVGSTTGPVRIAAQVTAVDRNDGTPRETADSLFLTVERPARLALAAEIVAPEEARQGRVLPGQAFRLRATFRNQGDAGVVDGAVPPTLRLVDLPAGFHAAAGEIALAPGARAVDFDILAPATPRPDGDLLRVGFGRLPHDANSGAPVELDPDSTQARVTVVVGNDAVTADATAAPSAVVVPGELDVALVELAITNDAAFPVRLEALGIEPQVDGVVMPGVFERFVLEAESGDRSLLEPADAPIAWITFPPHAALAPAATVRFVLRGDVARGAPARALGVAIAAAGAPRLRAVQASSGDPVPVRGTTPLPTDGVRVVDAALAAYNAPNPFHVGRETTTIHYQIDSATDVLVRVFTLQGELVWEARRFEAASAPALRAQVWDGRNGNGHAVRNGVYVCQVDAGTRRTRFKIAVAR